VIDNRTYANIEGRWRDLFNKMKVGWPGGGSLLIVAGTGGLGDGCSLLALPHLLLGQLLMPAPHSKPRHVLAV